MTPLILNGILPLNQKHLMFTLRVFVIIIWITNWLINPGICFHVDTCAKFFRLKTNWFPGTNPYKSGSYWF